jgi:peroxiredoxin Q/BCP
MNVVREVLAAAGLLALAATVGAQDATAPKVGEKAPDFALAASDGKQYHLKDFAGKSAVVLAWFPKAFTGG